jgi:hypothetical protein
MKRWSMLLTVALAAAFAATGCGQDNKPKRTGTTPTPTPVGTLTLTPTPTATPVSTEPTATRTPGPDGCEANALSLRVTAAQGGDLDTGWTGIAHNNETPSEVSVTVDLNCSGDECQVDGSALVGTQFGAPLPLSSGGVPVCVLNFFREAIGGTYTCTEGCGETQVLLESRVFLVQDIAQPCPICVGDDTPNDGVKNGTCQGSTTTPGAPCDIGAVDRQFGSTSIDCLPTGSSVGELEINLNPTTTGRISIDSSVDCISPFFPAGSCYCPGQIQPNACTDGMCPASGLCESGPIDGLCSNQRFRSCRSGTGTTDCDAVFPGSGTCVDSPRPCFGTNITREGSCAAPGEEGTLVSFFCIPATRAAAINTTAGLPGPGAVALPGSSVRTPR